MATLLADNSRDVNNLRQLVTRWWEVDYGAETGKFFFQTYGCQKCVKPIYLNSVVS